MNESLGVATGEIQKKLIRYQELNIVPNCHYNQHLLPLYPTLFFFIK